MGTRKDLESESEQKQENEAHEIKKQKWWQEARRP